MFTEPIQFIDLLLYYIDYFIAHGVPRLIMQMKKVIFVIVYIRLYM